MNEKNKNSVRRKKVMRADLRVRLTESGGQVQGGAESARPEQGLGMG